MGLVYPHDGRFCSETPQHLSAAFDHKPVADYFCGLAEKVFTKPTPVIFSKAAHSYARLANVKLEYAPRNRSLP